MINISIKASQFTPFVKIDPEKGDVVIKGNSSPENARKFYQPVFHMLEEIFQSSQEPIILNLAFGYFNIASSKCLFDLFRMLKKSETTNRKAIVNWFYEENIDEMKETGEDYADLLDMQFNFVELNQIKLPDSQTQAA